jgi:hypothetical protein
VSAFAAKHTLTNIAARRLCSSATERILISAGKTWVVKGFGCVFKEVDA